MYAYRRSTCTKMYAYRGSFLSEMTAYRRTLLAPQLSRASVAMQSTSFSRLRLTQVERSIEPFSPVKGQLKPRGGWLRSIRESLGRSVRTQAALAGVAASTLQKSEQSEADDRITLAQLRKLAEALDCELVYALVPRKPLHAMLEEQAESLARKEILGVAHTMALEDQRPSDTYIERKVAERREELLSGSWSRLWR